MKITNITHGTVDPIFAARETTIYDYTDREVVTALVEKTFREELRHLGRHDYTGFCVDIKMNHTVGLVRIGELSEDTQTLRVWCHRVPTSDGIFRNIRKWDIELKVVPLSEKRAEELVYTCEQVDRYGCPSTLKEKMFDYKHATKEENVAL